MQVFELVCPKAHLDSFEFVSNDHSDDFFHLFVVGNHFISMFLPIESLGFDILNDSNDIYVLMLDELELMFPMKVFCGYLFGDFHIADLVKLVILFFEFDERATVFHLDYF